MDSNPKYKIHLHRQLVADRLAEDAREIGCFFQQKRRIFTKKLIRCKLLREFGMVGNGMVDDFRIAGNQKLNMWKKVGLFRSLPPVERVMLLQVLIVLPVTHLGLRVIGVQRWYKLLGYLAKMRARHVAAIPQIERSMARAVQASWYSGNCLSRSLTLWWLLQRQGIAAEIQIGVRNGDRQFQAHAWVEVQGTPCYEAPDVRQHFTAFPRSPFAQSN